MKGHCSSVLSQFIYVLPECCGKGYSCKNTQPLEDVMWKEIFLVPKSVDVHLGHASPIGKKGPVHAGVRRAHRSCVLHLAVLLPTTVALSLFCRATPAALAAATSTRASLYLKVRCCFDFLWVFSTKFGTKADSVAKLVGRKLVWLPSCKLKVANCSQKSAGEISCVVVWIL